MENIIKKIRAFTLIELLAVIVVLTILLLIAVPIVLNVIRNAGDSAFESSARGLIKAVQNKYVLDDLNKLETVNRYEFDDGSFKETSPLFEHSGNLPQEGYIETDADGNIEMAITDGTRCVTKTFLSREITIRRLDNEQVCKILFPCGEVFVDSRDDKEYNTVQIGEQCWLSENLAYTGNGCLSNSWNESLPLNACRIHGPSHPGWPGSMTGPHTSGFDDEILYQWEAAMDGGLIEGSQGLCPEGWIIPTHNDWTELERTVCENLGNSNCEIQFPENGSTEGWRGTNEGTSLKSSSEFNGYLAGSRRASDGALVSVGNYAVFWTSSSSVSSTWGRHLYASESRISRDLLSRARGFSVRCILEQ